MIGPCQDTLQSISFLGQKDEFMFSLFFFLFLYLLSLLDLGHVVSFLTFDFVNLSTYLSCQKDRSSVA